MSVAQLRQLLHDRAVSVRLDGDDLVLGAPGERSVPADVVALVREHKSDLIAALRKVGDRSPHAQSASESIIVRVPDCQRSSDRAVIVASGEPLPSDAIAWRRINESRWHDLSA